MVDACKDLAVVKHARKTAVSMNFELQPNAKLSDEDLPKDDVKQTQASNTPLRPFRVDELRKLLSEKKLDKVDKS